MEYEPDIVSSKYTDAIRLYDILYDYNCELITVNNTYKEYYNELNKDETKETINVISMSELNELFKKTDVNITDVFNSVSINAENAINELLGIYNEHMGKQQEGKQPEQEKQQKQFGEKIELDDDVKPLDKIKKQLSTSEGKVYEGKVSSKAPLKTFSDSNSNTPLSQQSVVSVTGGKKKRNPRKNNKTKKRTKKLKKTKKKAHKIKKNYNKKKHNKKTKKMKKKRNNKNKAKKHNKHNKSKSKKHNKKQLFEMTIKELKEHVKNKNKNK